MSDAAPSSERGSRPLVSTSIGRGVATLTLDSPHNRNALSSALIGELLDAVTAATTDDRVRVIVLTHTGGVFCSGVDLKETAVAAAGAKAAGAAPSGAAMPAARLGGVLAAVWECPKPVVARIGGAARAGGLGLVAAADIAVCSTDATFAFTEVRLGVIPAVISATVLRRLAPRAAAELYLTGDAFDGVRAAQVGLVTEAVAPGDLDATVERYVASLVRGAPYALAAAKSLTRRPASGDIRDDLAELADMSVHYFASDEGREGMRAFADKREPSWLPRD